MRARIMRVLSHGTWHVYAQQIAYGLYLRTGVLTTVYILRLGWHGSVQGGGSGHMWTCAAQSCRGAVVPLTLPTLPSLPALSFTFLLFCFLATLFSLRQFPPSQIQKNLALISRTSYTSYSTLSPLHSYFFAFWPPFSALDSCPPLESKKVRTSALPSHP